MNIYFDDCGRTLLSGGYGEFCRGVLVGLLKTTEFQIFVAKEYYSKLLTFLDSIEIEKKNLKRWDGVALETIDVYLSLSSLHTIPIPNFGYLKVLITGSPFDGISEIIKNKVSLYDSVIFSGKVDNKNFSFIDSYDLPQPLNIEERVLFLNTSPIMRRRSSNFLFVGTFNYWKGLDISIKSFHFSDAPSGSKLRLQVGVVDKEKILGGDASEYLKLVRHQEMFSDVVLTYLKQADATLDEIKFDGRFIIIKFSNQNKIRLIQIDMFYVDNFEMSRIYQESDVLLSSSRGETWSMPVVESIAHGLSVVVSMHLGCVEYLKEFDQLILVDSQKSQFDEFDFSDRSSGGGKIYTNSKINFHESSVEDFTNSINKLLEQNMIRRNKKPDISVFENLKKIDELFGIGKIGQVYSDTLLYAVNKKRSGVQG